MQARAGRAARATKLVLLAALLLVLALGVARRSTDSYADLSGPYAGLDPDADYRRRLVMLALVHRASPQHDRFVDARFERMPSPPLWPSLIATTVLWTQPRDGPDDQGGFLQQDIERAAQRLALASSALGALVAALLAGGLASRAGFSWRPAVTAAVLMAASPLAVAREQASAIDAHALVALLALGQLGSCALAMRAVERIDVVVGSLAAGLFAGAGLATGGESWPVALGCFAPLAVLSARARREPGADAVVGPIVFALSALCVAMVARPDLEWRDLVPAFDGRARGLHARSALRVAFAFLAAAPTLWIVFRAPREPFRAVLLLSTGLSFALAWFDDRFGAPFHASLALSAGLAAGAVESHAGWSARKTAIATLFLSLAVALAWPPASDDELRAALARRGRLEAAFAWLRTETSAPGSFNHAEGPQLWRVASAPRLAGSLAHLARRPAVAIEHGRCASPSAVDLADAFALADEQEFTARMTERGVDWVLVCDEMLDDPLFARARGDDSALAKLLRPSEPFAGWTAAFSTAGAESEERPASSARAIVWRRSEASAANGARPSLRSR